jgi:y4mF family transcriptional regulator
MTASLSEVISYHRRKSGLTQQELAALAGVGKNMIYLLEHGKQSIRLDILLKILTVLNIAIDFQSPLMASLYEENHNADS